ncbi:hypothetical protein GCM10010468_47150 [Actinocorallia longicatena]|uniref:Phosphoadenosine phosphosulphate reductase domain-containing protein n=1 Tax=Actinocorallia longicatena TaxID=111803 RepID=A0ABP6QG72_9ACTN
MCCELFSGGKDCIVMLRLAEKAFAPAPVPFPVMHVDTGHNFDEVIGIGRSPSWVCGWWCVDGGQIMPA